MHRGRTSTTTTHARVRSCALLLAATALSTAACTSAGDPADAVSQDRTESTQALTIPDIVDAVQPSVVTVLTETGSGSGVIYDEDGTVITNEHVVRGQEQVQLSFADGAQRSATVVATDPVVDLAVLKTERTGLPPADFDTDLPEVGALAVVIGSPLGFQETVTAGVISGLHRSIPGSARTTASLVDLVQTDAPISPGNSGGALVDANGQVVGVTEAYLPPASGAVAIGFAIPAATVVDVVEELREDGTAEHAFLGLQPTTLSPELGRRLGADVEAGVAVLSVQDGGPADQAGVQPGDVLTALDDQDLTSAEALLAALRDVEPGDRLHLTVVRDGQETDLEVTVESRPA